jgi:hypothetical protein
MRKLQIESLEELEGIFRERSVDMTNNIREGIEEAMKAKKKTAPAKHKPAASNHRPDGTVAPGHSHGGKRPGAGRTPEAVRRM